MKNLFCTAMGVIGGAFVYLLGGWDTALTTLLICMGLDYITGLIVAGVFNNSPKTKNGALESSAGFKGLCRKIIMIVFVGVAYRLDILLNMNCIRYTVIIGFICNEVISLIENAGLTGLPIPKILIKAVDILKSREGDNNGN